MECRAGEGSGGLGRVRAYATSASQRVSVAATAAKWVPQDDAGETGEHGRRGVLGGERRTIAQMVGRRGGRSEGGSEHGASRVRSRRGCRSACDWIVGGSIAAGRGVAREAGIGVLRTRGT